MILKVPPNPKHDNASIIYIPNGWEYVTICYSQVMGVCSYNKDTVYSGSFAFSMHFFFLQKEDKLTEIRSLTPTINLYS